MRPLEGVRVLDLSRLLPGPYCSLLLADYGAEVIKVEDPGLGDYLRAIPPLVEGTSAYFQALNRNKQSLTLNLKDPEGVALFRRLAKEADVVLESFRPGVADRLGVGYQDLQAVNASLVYCAVTGYGQTGPLRDRSGHDLNYMALSGALAQLTGEAGPILPGVQVADMAGAMYGAFSIMMALYAREKSGKGTFLDVAMLDSAMTFLPFAAARARAQGRAPRVGETELTGAVAHYGTYRTKDGRFVALGALEEKFWRAFCLAAEHPDWLLERSQSTLREVLSSFFLTRTQAEWAEWAVGKDICLDPVLELHEAFQHPQIQARGMVDAQALSAAVPFPGAAVGPSTPAPKLGEHTDAILRQLGLSDAQRDELRARAVL